MSATRRQFLQSSAMLVVGFALPMGARGAAAASTGPGQVNAFIRIAADGRVTLLSPKVEMGQGVYTSLAQLVAEELEVPFESIAVEAAPVDKAYNHPFIPIQFTGGSMSVATTWEPLRKAGATARTLLIDAAAARWSVPGSELVAEKGRVLHRASGRSAGYGELAGAAAALPAPADVKLKDPRDFKVIGRSVRRVDTPAKVDGTALFGLDARVPGMAFAMVARPPLTGASLVAADEAAARKVPGVIDVVRIPTGVAVIATSTWAANRGRDALAARWDLGDAVKFSTDRQRSDHAALVTKPGAVAANVGDVDAALAQSARRLSAQYSVPYLAHASMEPLNCLARVEAGRCEVWTGTQMQSTDRESIAVAAGLAPEQVQIHTLLLGGGFGRRANPAADFLVEAVQVAKASKRPVLVTWTREDDTRGGYYRPSFADAIEAGLDASGALVALRHRIAGQSVLAKTQFAAFAINKETGVDFSSVEGSADTAYAIPNRRTELHTTEAPPTVLWWRSVGHSHVGFVFESFIDELAHAAGRDPIAYRLGMLASHPRHVAVLERVRERSGWGSPLAAGRARGVAVHESFGSVVAHVAEVSVADGRVRVHRVVSAIHCGRAVNPSGIEAQVQSAIVYGLSAALDGEITFVDGAVQQGNFNDYPALRLDEMPVIEVHVIDSDANPTGVGEPGLPPIAPAVTNALFALTGKRVRDLPLSRHFSA